VIAPAVAFRNVFENQGVSITMQEARLPMGFRKDLHIKAIAEIPEVRARWKEVHGDYPTQKNIDDMFTDFVPTQINNLGNYSQLIPGVRESIHRLKTEYKLKIGMTTGFSRKISEVLRESAAAQGYIPDCIVAGDEVANGARPKPFMIYKNLEKLNIHPIDTVVKVDDTVGGIGEGLEAGCWTVGVSRYGNYMNIDSLSDENNLSSTDIAKRNDKSRNILKQAGAHYVVDSIIDLPIVVEDINNKLRQGKTPRDF